MSSTKSNGGSSSSTNSKSDTISFSNENSSTKGTTTETGKSVEASTGKVDKNVQNKYNYYNKKTNATQSDLTKTLYNGLQSTLKNQPSAWQDNWSNFANDIWDKLQNYGSFSYNMNNDALYNMYKDNYTSQGKSAMADTMGQASALTGGYGSSYSQTAGQQAYQDYLTQLNDIVPELQEQAYNQWSDQRNDLYNQYDLVSNERTFDYNKYRDSVDDYQTMLDYYTSNYLSSDQNDTSKFESARDYFANQYWNQKNAEKTTNSSSKSKTNSKTKSSSNTNSSTNETSNTNENSWSNSFSSGSGGGKSSSTSDTDYTQYERGAATTDDELMDDLISVAWGSGNPGNYFKQAYEDGQITYGDYLYLTGSDSQRSSWDKALYDTDFWGSYKKSKNSSS